MARTRYAVAGLTTTIALTLVGNGLLGSLLGVRAERDGIGAAAMGVANAMFYAGFLAGIPLMNWALQHLSRRRLYLTSTAAMGLTCVLYGLSVDATSWVVLRGLTGFCLAGCYLVVETWLNDLAHAGVRGKVMGVYIAFSAAGLAFGQLILFVVDASRWTSFAVAGIVTGFAWLPLIAVNNGAATVHSRAAAMSVVAVARAVPSGVLGFVLVGVTQGCLLSMAAVYAARAGLSPGAVGLFVGSMTAGAITLQIPVGTVSDRRSRRGVIVALCVITTALCTAMLLTTAGSWVSFALIFVVGGFSAPLYAVCSAYTVDWLPRDQIVSASTALLTTYSIGAVVGPLLAAVAMTAWGDDGWFWSLIVGHLLLGGFMTYRMVVAPDRAAAPTGLD